jgi:hypothetical protein
LDNNSSHIKQVIDKLELFLLKKSPALIKYFPIIRIQLSYFLTLIRANKFEAKNISTKIYYTKHTFTFSDFVALVRIWFVLFRLKILNKNLLKNKVLLFGFAHHYYGQENTKSNLYISTFKQELITKKIEHQEYFYSYGDSPGNNPVRLKMLYDTLYHYQSLVSAFKFKLFNKYNSYINNAELLKSFLVQNEIEHVEHCTNLIYNSLIEQEIRYNTFKQFLKTLKPQLIWTYCYYDNSIMALSRAANYLKIKTVEYQHSIQGDGHFAYSKWNKVDLYSNFFPKAFWVWRTEDADNILKNFSGLTYTPQVIVGGNIAAQYQKEKSGEKMKKNETPNGILVSLQGGWIKDFVEKAIAKDEKYTWYFRLHPRYPQDKEKLLALKDKFPDKVEIDLANRLSLHELFKNVCANITDFSGVALEAQEFGIKNIIVGEKGYQIYKSEIETNYFFYASYYQELCDILYGQVLNKTDISRTVEATRDNLDKAINQLLTEINHKK